ncbi:hypothetical protein [Natronobacterium gregoryi]|uniref:Uncharacterized protein n=2 Tax=Natronobacterium gregoryi TaxID=44930 RepID=L0AKS3_NATGS|nr:hypothetical protein [Natronobacterium gregoryi]AFZ74503.1 hypothetical protein Natgr_3383 [Natronobacterium gregoryi SP2]ELY72423.1 hypothetical protein C490_03728 [Natronobacterium gregoryi SP2]PLK21751.1 hypothetical protein CYV19_02635 [Natronobacterium gregoryi SP2]SFI98302.1 hypothetical protein SAMN05443661_110204 [Natronobacterium gregoryi]
MDRRTVLAGVGGTLSVSVVGCLDTSRLSSRGGDASESETGDDFDPDIEPTTRLGDGERTSIEAEPDREYEYVDADDSVRITYDSGKTNEMSFDEWGTRRATAAAASHVRSSLSSEELLGTGVFVATGVAEVDTLEDAPEDLTFDRAIPLGVLVDYNASYSRGGDLRSEPDVEFDAIVAATPRAVDVTMLFEERPSTAVVPAFCRRGWSRED